MEPCGSRDVADSVGVEPATYRLTVGRFTAELQVNTGLRTSSKWLKHGFILR